MFRKLITSVYNNRSSAAKDEFSKKPSKAVVPKLANEKKDFKKKKIGSLKAFRSSSATLALRKILGKATSTPSDTSSVTVLYDSVEVPVSNTQSDSELASAEQDLSPIVFATIDELNESVLELSLPDPILPLSLSIPPVETSKPVTESQQTTEQHSTQSGEAGKCGPLESHTNEDASVAEGAVAEIHGATVLDDSEEVPVFDTPLDSEPAAAEQELSPTVVASVPEPSNTLSDLSQSDSVAPPSLAIPPVETSKPAPHQTTELASPASQYSTQSAESHAYGPRKSFNEDTSVQGAVVEIPPCLTNAFQADIPATPTTARAVSDRSPRQGSDTSTLLIPSPTSSLIAACGHSPRQHSERSTLLLPPREDSQSALRQHFKISKLILPPSRQPSEGSTPLLPPRRDSHSALCEPAPVTPSKAPAFKKPCLKIGHAQGADTAGASADVSFHELSSGQLRFQHRKSGGVFSLTFKVGVIPSSKGYPFTKDNYHYDSETSEVTNMNEDDILRRCPIVKVYVDEHVSFETKYPHAFLYTASGILGKGAFGCAVSYTRENDGRLSSDDEDVANAVSKYMVLKFLAGPENMSDAEDKMVEINHMLALNDCPWIVPYLGDNVSDMEGKIPYAITMPFYSTTLEKLLKEVPRPELNEVKIRLLAQLIVAVYSMHRRGIAHFDLKPENIFISNTGHIVLGDLGISRFVAPNGKVPSAGGSFPYQAPEISTREVCSKEADWYSVGVIAYHILSGVTNPFKEGTDDKYGIPEAEPLHDLTYPQGDFVMRLLERNPEDRLTDFRKMTWHPVFEQKDGTMIDWNEVQNRRGNGLVRDLLAAHFNGA